MPTFDLESASKLLNGKFHEEVEDDYADQVKINNLTVNAKSYNDMIHDENIKKFEMQLQSILEK